MHKFYACLTTLMPGGMAPAHHPSRRPADVVLSLHAPRGVYGRRPGDRRGFKPGVSFHSEATCEDLAKSHRANWGVVVRGLPLRRLGTIPSA